MAITPAPDTAPAAVLEAARELVVGVSDRLPAAWSDDELLEGMSAAQRLRGAADALELRMLAEVDVRELPRKRLHWGSTADWFTHLTGGFRRDGRRRVRHARALATDYTATLDGGACGETSLTQAGVVCEAVETLPTNPALRAEAEQVLLEQSRTLTATELVRAGGTSPPWSTPTGEERAAEAALDREERAAHLQRFLSVVGRRRRRGPDQGLRIGRGRRGPPRRPAPADQARAAGRPRRPDLRDRADPRDHGARMWDALVQTAQHSLDTDLPPESHGTRPRVVVTTTLEALQHGPTEQPGRPRPGSSCRWPPSDGWPATPRSSPGSSTPTARSSTSAAPNDWSPSRSGSP